MNYNKNLEYIIKSVSTDDKQGLEDLLNNMSKLGWELYTIHEVEMEDGFDYNCIFMRDRKKDNKEDLDDIVDVTNFKYRMEKMLAAPSSPYASCKEIQLKIANQKERIKKIKNQLESDSLSPDEKNQINNQMADELKQLELLKQTLVNEISPKVMYSKFKEEKLAVYLSEEILSLISLEEPNNLLAETVKIRQELAENLGYVIPHVHFHSSDELFQNEFSVRVRDLDIVKAVVFPDYIAYFKDELNGYEIQEGDIEVDDAISNKSLVWLHVDKVKDFWQKGMSSIEYIGYVVKNVALREVSNILDYNDINQYIEIVNEHNSFLVDNIFPMYLTASDIKYLITCLIRENVSVKNIVYLFEKLNDYATEESKDALLDKVRLALSKYIVKDLIIDDEVKVVEFTEETIDLIYSFFKNEEDEDGTSPIVRIDAKDVQSIAKKILKIAKNKNLSKIILAVPMEIRHMVYVILSDFIPNLTVLALEELCSDFQIKFITKI